MTMKFNNSISLTKISRNISSNIITRNVGSGKKIIGHVSKIIEILNKNDTITPKPSKPKKVPTNKEVTPLPQQVNLSIDQNIDVKKQIAYLVTYADSKETFVKYPSTNCNTVNYFVNTEKNNIICGSSSKRENVSYINHKVTESQNKDYRSIVNFLFDNQLPGNPMFRLQILERSNINLVATRGLIFQHIVEQVETYGDPLCKKAISYLVIENLPGKANLNFITELRVSFKYSQFAISNETPKAKIKEIRVLHDTIVNSTEQKASLSFTGQKNCDLRVIYNIDGQDKYIYFDIKQKILSPTDFSYNYLKIIYYENEFSSKEFLDQRDKYIKGLVKTLEMQYDQVQDVQVLINRLKTLSIDDKFRQVYEFVILNHDRPYGRMVILLQDNISISNIHRQNLDTIDDADVQDFDSQMFIPQNLDLFNQKTTKFLKSKSGQSLTDRFKKQALDDSIKFLNAWKTSDSIPSITDY